MFCDDGNGDADDDDDEGPLSHTHIETHTDRGNIHKFCGIVVFHHSVDTVIILLKTMG